MRLFRTALVLLALLVFGAAAANAAGSLSQFVGNYGEVISYRGDYQVEATMHRAKEVVVFYPPALTGSSTAPLQTDTFAPADFEKFGIVELVVIPKTDTDVRSLEQLVNLRSRSLREMHGVKFDSDTCAYGHGCYIVGVSWPPETTKFSVSEPFHLWQLYTESQNEFYILTSGADITYDSWTTPMAYSLMHSVTGAQAEQSESLESSWRDVRKTWLALWGIVMGCLAGLAFAPVDKWRSKRRILAGAGVIFSNGYLIFACVVAFGARASRGPINDAIFVGGIGAVLGIAASFVGAKFLKASNPTAAALAAAGASLPALILAWSARHDPPVSVSGALEFALFFMMIQGLIAGLAWGATVRLKEAARAA